MGSAAASSCCFVAGVWVAEQYYLSPDLTLILRCMPFRAFCRPFASGSLRALLSLIHLGTNVCLCAQYMPGNRPRMKSFARFTIGYWVRQLLCFSVAGSTVTCAEPAVRSLQVPSAEDKAGFIPDLSW